MKLMGTYVSNKSNEKFAMPQHQPTRHSREETCHMMYTIIKSNICMSSAKLPTGLVATPVAMMISEVPSGNQPRGHEENHPVSQMILPSKPPLNQGNFATLRGHGADRVSSHRVHFYRVSSHFLFN